MQKPPLLTARHALFLDFDGTLADIAPHPDAVQVHPGVVPALRVLHERLDGALAIATGRTQADIDHFLSPCSCRWPANTEPSTGWATASPAACRRPTSPPWCAPYSRCWTAIPRWCWSARARAWPCTTARRWSLEPLCRAALEHALAQAPGLEIMQGKCVLEIKPSGPNKGRAIADFMRQAPFAGRIPVFAGDDVTDEYGFDAAQALGGIGIKIGAGDTRALARCDDTTELREWLFQMASPEGFPA